jgi:hypothetical protein
MADHADLLLSPVRDDVVCTVVREDLEHRVEIRTHAKTAFTPKRPKLNADECKNFFGKHGVRSPS